MPRCQKCCSQRIVQQTPATPGPAGWSERCRECGHVESFTAPDFTCPTCGYADQQVREFSGGWSFQCPECKHQCVVFREID